MRTWLAGIVACTAAVNALGCGIYFPNTFLNRGDAALLAAPVASFYLELERMELRPSGFSAVRATNGYYAQTGDADIADLRAALERKPLSAVGLEDLLSRQQAERSNVAAFQAALSKWERGRGWDWVGGRYTQLPASLPRPEIGTYNVRILEDLPAEFREYFRGALAWHAGKTDEARAAWEALLNLPEAERAFRSTWAAYMLGRSWETEDPDKAINYFRMTRRLASGGFKDSLGLAASSLGWEAAVNLRQARFDKAIELYLDEMAAGSTNARLSLRLTASQICNSNCDALSSLATNARVRRVITAYIISCREPEYLGVRTDGPLPPDPPLGSTVRKWLEAVEKAGVTDLESAEELALAAYRVGQWDIAERWIRRAPATPTAKWLEAKLLLRAGKLDEAAARLAEVTRYFPLEPADTNQPVRPGLKDALSIPGPEYPYIDDVSAARLVRGELGVLQLARREYTEALDSLLRSGFWTDASYVAERVLSADELKVYVDRHWPAMESTESNTEQSPAFEAANAGAAIRHLLARRLTRSNRGTEARAYYPVKWQADFDALIKNLQIGWETNQPAETRARALFEAAKSTRYLGMELMGTEIGPDWFFYGGDIEGDFIVARRSANDPEQLVKASTDELNRAEANTVDPERRFHYRYQAAALGWEAARLLPNNNDETARILCLSGTWLKDIDLDSADIFYKALVRRCRKTALGDQADRMRWFPVIDKAGNVAPWSPAPLVSSEWKLNPADDGNVGGYFYTLAKGNSLRDVVDAARTDHNLVTTVHELMQANPEISHPARVSVGQEIFVPAAAAESRTPDIHH